MYPLSSPTSLQLSYSQHWYILIVFHFRFQKYFVLSHPSLFPFVFPTTYSFSLNSPLNSTSSLQKRSTSTIRHGLENDSQHQSTLHNDVRSKKLHIKKAFKCFYVIYERTTRTSCTRMYIT